MVQTAVAVEARMNTSYSQSYHSYRLNTLISIRATPSICTAPRRAVSAFEGGGRVCRVDRQQRGGHRGAHRRSQLGDLEGALSGTRGGGLGGGKVRRTKGDWRRPLSGIVCGWHRWGVRGNGCGGFGGARCADSTWMSRARLRPHRCMSASTHRRGVGEADDPLGDAHLRYGRLQCGWVDVSEQCHVRSATRMARSGWVSQDGEAAVRGSQS